MRRALVALALAATACKVVPASPDEPSATGTREATPAGALGDTARIAIGRSASWDAGRFVVTFDTVEADSRCPADAMCVWQGDAAARFHVAAGDQRAKATLHTALEPKQLAHAGYVLRLVNVEPYPGTFDRSKAAPAPVAVVIVKRP